jgi:hypothetical protein
MPNPEFWIALAILGMTICLAVVQGRAQDRLVRLERKVDALLKQAGIDPTPPVSQEVGDLARQGKKIEAIKLYREQTGAGLAEAKEQVEALERGS